MYVEKSLEEILPLPVLVKLIEDHHRQLLPRFRESNMPRNGFGSAKDDSAIVDTIPVQISGTQATASSRLAYLARSAHEGHLAMLRQVTFKNVLVQPGSRCHGPFYDIS